MSNSDPTQPVALVTGGSRGIGAAVARRLSAAGAAVLVAARSTDACEALAAELRAGGADAWPLELDVTDPASIESAVARARELAGPIDWLVNNAGIAISAPLSAGDELYERHLAVNFHGPRRVLEACLPDMLERGLGRVVQVASSAALVGYAYVSAYCASKHALLGYSRAAAEELRGKGISVATVCPHYVDSPMLAESVRRVVEKTGKSEAEARAFFAAQNPSGRLVTEEQVADAVLDLLRGGETGVVVELDGSGR